MKKIKIHFFTKQYKNHLVQVNDITIQKRLSLIHGKNGSGKSTLLKAIAGFITFEGDIHINGTTGYSSEMNVFPHYVKVLDFINAMASIERTRDIVLLLQLLSLEEKVDEYIHHLSKGMKAKLRFLVMYMFEKDIYLLDEPFSGVDQESIQQMKHIMQTSSSRFLIASHLIEEFEDIAQEVIHID